MKQIFLILFALLPIGMMGQNISSRININGEVFRDYEEFFEGYRMPEEMIQLAKSVWWHFPKGGRFVKNGIMVTGTGRTVVNEDDFEFILLMPADRLSLSLKDSIEAAIARELSNATVANVVKKSGQDGDTLSYTLAWFHRMRSQDEMLEKQRKPGHITPNSSAYANVYFDMYQDQVFFYFRFDDQRARLGLVERKQEKADITGLDELLDGLKHLYKTKTKKVIFPADDIWNTEIGYVYSVDCDAEKEFDAILRYVGSEYLMKHTPQVTFQYGNTEDMITIRMLRRVGREKRIGGGSAIQNEVQDREVQICCRGGKLLILDVISQDDREANRINLSCWEAMLGEPDDNYPLPGKLTKKANRVTLQVRDDVFGFKRKNMFSSTYIFEKETQDEQNIKD